MSAIAGIYRLDGEQIGANDLQLMLDTMAHRGPDGQGIWESRSLGFGHRMLHTTTESLTERLPLVYRSGHFVITADAVIYNRDELATKLALSNTSAASLSDSELIVMAYARWGEQCVNELLGDFAFAIWDDKRHVCFCARDHFGIRPFYYYRNPGKILAFASEIKALLCLTSIPRKLDELRLAEILENIVTDNKRTIYEGILRLPPGHCLVISSAGERLYSYWQPNASVAGKDLKTDRDCHEAFHDIFGQAVKCRMRSHFPLGSMLSGGLDSSTVTCMARQMLANNGGGPLHTFSALCNEVPQSDETRFIEAVLAQGGCTAHFVDCGDYSTFYDVQRACYHLDDGHSSYNLFYVWAMFIRAQQLGVRVMLTGVDGDGTASHGYGLLNELAAQQQWSVFATECDQFYESCGWRRPQLLELYGFPYLTWLLSNGHLLSYVKQLVVASRTLGVSLPHSFRRTVGPLSCILPGFMRDLLWTVHKPWKVIDRRFAARIGFLQHVASYRATNIRQTPQSERAEHLQNVTMPVILYGCEGAEKGAAAHSIEMRHPYYDKRLVEYCLSLPPEQKTRNGLTRYHVRRALQDILPEEVFARPGKSDYSSVFNHSIHKFDMEFLEEMLRHPPGSIDGYVDIDLLRLRYRQATGKDSGHARRQLCHVWRTLNMGMWLEYAGLSH